MPLGPLQAKDSPVKLKAADGFCLFSSLVCIALRQLPLCCFFYSFHGRRLYFTSFLWSSSFDNIFST